MARPSTKDDLLAAAQGQYRKLAETIASLSEQELSRPFDFSKDEKKTEAHWRRDKNLRDVLIHLYEWHTLILNWVSSNMNGEAKPFIPEPYNWKTFGLMNIGFWEKHQKTSLEEAKALYEKSHNEVVALLDTFTNQELFSKSAFAWVGGSTLGSYFVSATASHYDWALKKLKAHKRMVFR